MANIPKTWLDRFFTQLLIWVNGTAQNYHSNLKFVAGTNVTLTPAEDVNGDANSITIAASGGGGGSPAGALNDVQVHGSGSTFAADTGNFAYDPTLHSFIAGEGNTTPAANWTCAIGVNNTASGAGSAAFGDTSTASGTVAFATGSNNIASGDDTFVMGSSCTATDTACFAGGDTCTAGSGGAAYNSFAFGSHCQALSFYAVAIGYTNIASGEGSLATGLITTANQFGERAHNSLADGVGNTQDEHKVALYVEANGAPTNAVTGGSAELVLPDSSNLSMRVRIMATLASVGTPAHEVHEMLVQTVLGTVNIPPVADDIITDTSVNLASQGWSVTMSCPSPLVLRFLCDPGADDVKFFILVTWASMPGS